MAAAIHQPALLARLCDACEATAKVADVSEQVKNISALAPLLAAAASQVHPSFVRLEYFVACCYACLTRALIWGQARQRELHGRTGTPERLDVCLA